MTIKPDFLIIPMVVYDHPKLSPTDKIIYAIVYWYEHMRDGRCTAANATIGLVAGIDDRTVRVGLERLEDAGFIRREFKDKKRKQRLQIQCLVRYAPTEPAHEVPKDQASLPGLPAVRPDPSDRKETPGEFAKRFFDKDEEAHKSVIEAILMRVHGHVDKGAVEREIRKFWVYWTEPNKSGTKQKWQLQETFDVHRRIYTWLSRAGTYGSKSRAGTGVTV